MPKKIFPQAELGSKSGDNILDDSVSRKFTLFPPCPPPGPDTYFEILSGLPAVIELVGGRSAASILNLNWRVSSRHPAFFSISIYCTREVAKTICSLLDCSLVSPIKVDPEPKEWRTHESF